MTLKQREPRLYDTGFLEFLRRQPCCICGVTRNVEAAHIRIGFLATRMKPHDKHAVPLCAPHHRTGEGGVVAQHSMSETEWWGAHRLDPFAIAERLYAEYGGDGGQPKVKRKTTKPRKPKHLRAKIQSRGFR
jgi:hypothetical protein